MVSKRILPALALILFSLSQMGGCKNRNGETVLVTAPVPGFDLTAPDNGSQTSSIRPSFSWSAAPDVTSYTLQISTKNDFSSISIQQQQITSTTFELGVNLQDNTTYFWRVYAAVGNTLILAEGSPRFFTTPRVVPASFGLSAPSNGSTGISRTPILDWEDANGADSYSIEVSLSANFTSTVAEAVGLTESTFTLPIELAAGTPHYWRVVAHNTIGSTPASNNPFTFTTGIVITPPGSFTLALPTQDSQISAPYTPTYSWSASTGAESYTLQVSLVQDFASFVLNQAGITETWFIQPTTLGAGSTYYWRVQAVNGAGSILATNAPFRFTTQSSVPGTFTLIAPEQNSTNIILKPAFSWNGSTGAATYTLQVSTRVDFTGDLSINQSDITGTSITSPVTLAGNTTYYWRVTAVNAAGSTLSNLHSFRTETGIAPPGDFTLAEPANGIANAAVKPAFRWNPSSGATSYTLHVSKSSTFSGVYAIDQTGITQASYTSGVVLEAGTQYFWRVIAVNTSGSKQSAAFSFTTVVGGGGFPSDFTLASPVQDAEGVSLRPTLSWNPSSNHQSYSLQVARDSRFGDIVHQATGIPSTMNSYTWPALMADLDPAQKYFWQVIAINTAGSKIASNAPFSFVTQAAPPASFSLIGPDDQSTGLPVLPLFSWNSSERADSYTLQVCTSSAFDRDPLTVDLTGIRLTSITSPVELAFNTTYHWRILAVNGAGSTQAGPRSFKTAPRPIVLPGAFALSTPQNGVQSVALDTRLTWGASQNATHYTFQMSRSSDFSTIDFERVNLTDTSAGPFALLNTTTYYWQVFAENNDGRTRSDSVFSFRTDGIRPGLFSLTAPADGALRVDLRPLFSWTASANATLYRLQVSKNSTFSPLLINQPTDALQYQTPAGGELEYSTSYYWKVIATRGEHSLESGIFSFRTRSLLPEPFGLTSPAQDAQGVNPVRPTFSWEASVGQYSYILQVANNAQFVANPFTGQKVFIHTTLAGTTYTHTGTLEASDVYFWRVMAVNTAGSTICSDGFRRFYSPTQPPVAAQLLTPLQAATLSEHPTFTWAQAAQALSYRFEISPSASFWPLTHAQDGITVLTYTPSVNLTQNVRYYWRITSVNHIGSAYSETRYFSYSAPPAAATLVSPAANATGTPTGAQTFSWNTANGAATYDLEVSTNPDFTGTVHAARGLLWTTASTVFPLTPSTTYSWRIVSRNTSGSTPSLVRTFTTQAGPPAPFGLLLPANNATTSMQPLFSWNASQGAQHYRLQITRITGPTGIPDFTQLVANVQVIATSEDVLLNKPGVKHYWRVIAVNATGNRISETRSFTPNP